MLYHNLKQSFKSINPTETVEVYIIRIYVQKVSRDLSSTVILLFTSGMGL